MTTLTKAVTSAHLQGAVRRAMAHAATFRVEHDLPDFLRGKLAELDRAAARTDKRRDDVADPGMRHPV